MAEREICAKCKAIFFYGDISVQTIQIFLMQQFSQLHNKYYEPTNFNNEENKYDIIIKFFYPKPLT